MFAPPSPEELQQAAGQSDLFAPPTAEELGQIPAGAASTDEGPARRITQDELRAVASKLNLTKEQLDEVKRELPVMGAFVEGEEGGVKEVIQYGIGSVGRVFGVQGLASKLSRKLKDPQVEAALDILQNVTADRRPGWETAAELVASIPIPIGVTSKVGSAAAVGAAMGAAQAYGASEKETEGISTAVGAGIGAILGAGGQAAVNRFLSGKAQKAIVDAGRTQTVVDRVTEAAKRIEPEYNRAAEVINSPDIDNAIGALLLDKKAVDLLVDEASTASAEGRLDLARALSSTLKRGVSDEELAQAVAERKILLDLGEVADYLKANGDIEKMKRRQWRDPNKLVAYLQEEKRLGPQRITQAIEELKTYRAAGEALARDVETLTNKQPGTITQLLKGIIDGRVRLGMIDDRLGSSLEVAADRSARMMNDYTKDLHRAAHMALDIDKKIQELPTPFTKDQIFGLLNDPKAVIPDQLKDIAVTYKQYTDELANTLNTRYGSALLKPTEFQRYVLNTTVDMPEFIRRMQQRFDGIKAKVGIDPLEDVGKTAARWKEITETKEFEEIKQALELFTGRKLSNPEQFLVQGRKSLSPAGIRDSFETTSTSLLKREGKIPDFLMEKDPAKLLLNWAERNLRPAAISPFISELRKVRNIAIQRNDKDAIQYTSNLIADLTGTRSGTVARGINDYLTGVRSKLLIKADRLPKGSFSQKAVRFAAEAPDFLPMLSSQVYPNYLGWSPRATVGNLAQPFMMTLPELGAYGIKKIPQALAEVATQLPGVLTGKMRKELLEEGLVGHSYFGEIAAIRSGLEKSKIFKVTEKGMQKMSEVGMWLFEKSEEINRLVNRSLGKTIAKDLAEGNKEALRFIGKISPAYQRAIKAAGSDQEKVAELVQDYLIGKTLFNYNKQTLSAFGRYMGPYLSAFTKWPSAVSGDVVRTLTQKSLPKASMDLGYRYLGPLAAAIMVHRMLPEDFTEGEVYKSVFGEEGIAATSPVFTLKQMAQGSFFTPPIIGTTKDLAGGILTADPSKVWRWVNSTAESFLPGAWTLRVLSKDIYPWALDEAPPKASLIQRLVEPTIGWEPDEEIQELTDILKGRD